MLDYVIASGELIRYIKNMQINTAKQFTPWRTLKSSKRFSDHNASILKVEYNKIPSQSESDRENVWNFNHRKGWKSFHKITSTKHSLSDCWSDISGVETGCEKWSDRLNSILKDCFQSVGLKSKNKYMIVESDS